MSRGPRERGLEATVLPSHLLLRHPHPLLAQQGLVEQLYEWLDADRDYQYDYEELSVLVANRRLDAGNPRHIAFVKKYWEDHHVLVR